MTSSSTSLPLYGGKNSASVGLSNVCVLNGKLYHRNPTSQSPILLTLTDILTNTALARRIYRTGTALRECRNTCEDFSITLKWIWIILCGRCFTCASPRRACTERQSITSKQKISGQGTVSDILIVLTAGRRKVLDLITLRNVAVRRHSADAVHEARIVSCHKRLHKLYCF
jgi:hypothetical protein